MSRVLTQFHENERLLLWVQGYAGRLSLWVAASALLLWLGDAGIMPAALAAVMLHPAGRRLYLSIAAGVVFALKLPFLPAAIAPLSDWWPVAAATAAGIGLLYLAYRSARWFAHWPAIARRHPVLLVHAGVWIVLSLGALPWLGMLGMASFFAWRLSYLAVAASRDRLGGARFRDHLFYLVPAWGGTATPYGKGLDFLARHEAADAAAFARSQLAGLKLLLLAVLWIHAGELLDVVVFSQPAEALPAWPTMQPLAWLSGWTLGWARLDDIVASGAFPAWHTGWAILYLELVRATLSIAALGHVIVGSLRLLGFNVFRNTYKPLLAESVVEFWNRYYHYFKELLVDFFFYPTYLRLRRLGPRARLFVAVFAAACLGNMYHHILIRPEYVVHFDPVRLWEIWSPRLVYCVLLALGVWISMLRQQKLRAAGATVTPAIRVRRIAGVCSFYAIIQVWNVTRQGVGIGDCTAFLLSLFGI